MMKNAIASVMLLQLFLTDGSAVTVNITTETVDGRACRPGYDQFSFCNTSLSKVARVEALIAELQDQEIPPLLTAREGGGGSPGPPGNISRLGIPAFDWGLNCVHGVESSCVMNVTTGKTTCPTSFPNPVNLGATWNSTLWREIGHVLGLENRALWLAGATEYRNWSGRPHIGLDCWAPNINLNHDPRWGRNQEVASEDPTLNGLFGYEITKGEQVYRGQGGSKFLQSVPTIKHWAVYNLEDSDGHNRHNFNAEVNNASLADSFFPAFRKSIVGGSAKGVMCSYNAVNGIPTCGSPMLANVLRDVWNFTGFVSSDTGAVEDIYKNHKYVKTPEEAACIAIRDGQTDIDSGVVYHQALWKGVANGNCTRQDVNRALANSLGVLFDLGLFDPIKDEPLWHVPIDSVNTESSIELSKQSTLESMVLLKNSDNVLPLRKGGKIAVIGPHYNSQESLVGNYYGQICKDDTFNCVTKPVDAIKESNAGGSVVTSLGCDVQCSSDSGFPQALAAMEGADAVVLMVGTNQSIEAESHDRKSISLPGKQGELVAQVLAKAHTNNQKTVVVLINGGCVSLGPNKDAAPAILEAFFPGVYGSNAIAATLFGDNNHLGGKLAYTVYPADYVNQIRMDVVSLNAVGTPGRSYKYYTGTPEFEFGFGLSLTEFRLSVGTSPMQLDCNSDASSQVQVKVENVGGRTQDEVVMLYRIGGTTGNGLPLKKKLLSFQRVHLAPSALKVISFYVTSADFADVQVNGNRLCLPANNKYSLLISNGNDQNVPLPVTITGSARTVSVFPNV